ncbi:hypothetical protein IIC65_07480, partial [Candidatus Sumerlaeota bacterium]|nr:hypothetical protein [Candidatus Sumerlaeota bacterium]
MASQEASAPTPLQVGTVSLDLVSDPHTGGAGQYGTAEVGDYRLSNGKVTLIFAAVRTPEEGEGNPEINRTRVFRTPGSLIDVLIGENRVDFLGEFTQGIGIGPDGPIIQYEYAEFIEKAATRTPSDAPVPGQSLPPALGLKLMGPLPVPDGGIIETIYWLAAGESRLRVESKIVEGESQISIADVADWGSAAWIIAENNGRSAGGTGRFHDVQWYVAGAGKQAISSGVFGGEMRGYFVSRRTRVEGFREVGDQRIPFHTRWLFFSDNDFSGATDPVFHQASDADPIGVFEGQVLQ